MTRELICIGCPMGCELTVEVEDGKAVSVTGNTCGIGKKYAETEVSAPTRMVTTTVMADNGKPVPVKTRTAVPKEKISDVVKAVKSIGSTPTAILGALEPVTAVSIGVLVFGEILTGRLVVGITLILGSVVLIAAKRP